MEVLKLRAIKEDQLRELLLHEGKKEKYIMDTKGMTEKTYANVESAVSAKFTVAMFYCICFTIDHI